MTTTLQEAYGEDAWTLAPLSFSLPADLGAWRAWLDQHAAAGTDPGPWMLKTAQHLGKGLKLLPGEEAYAQALLPRYTQSPSNPTSRPYCTSMYDKRNLLQYTAAMCHECGKQHG